MRKITKLLVVTSLGMLVGCAPHAMNAPKTATGKKIQLYLALDRGLRPDMDAKAVEQYNTVGSYMEKNFVRMARNAGYAAARIPDAGEFTSAPGAYLVQVKVLDYNPGSKAARMLIGFGAGATSMDIHYELSADGRSALLAKDDGVGSSVDWPKVVAKLDQQMLDAISGKLGGR